MHLHRITSLVLFLLWLSATAGKVHAQCNRTGWVAGTVAGCGVQLLDLDNGELLLAVGGAADLSGGQTVRFSADYVPVPPGCGGLGLPTVTLTCVSDTLPCQAKFNYVVDNLNPYQFEFIADIYDATLQQCHWDFGDGAIAAGVNVAHTFSQEGYFTVCLTVTDGNGCNVQQCKDVFVSDQSPGWCGYDVQLTAVGTALVGALEPLSATGGELISIQWFDSKTDQILAQTPDFTYTLPSYGTYFVCAQYQVKNDDGSICSNTLCRQLSVSAPGCVMPELVNSATICPSFFAPVCGCDGITYGNECEAMSAGVTTWWAGSCANGGAGNCSADLSWEVLSGTPNSGYEVRFTNLAAGDYALTQLDFGDGTPIYEASQWSTKTHQYSHGGIFRVSLTVWKNNSCVSSVTKLLITDAAHISSGWLPGPTDYVMPGDANGDGRANVHDLLNIGIGYNSLGAPRPNATTAWAPQYAPNWAEATGAGVNFKHLDCDGNGFVNEFDPSAIQMHYQAIDTTAVVWNPSAPDVRLVFQQDTLYVNPNNPQPIEFSADIVVGSVAEPVFGLYGLSMALKYPEYIDHDPVTNYYDDSFFGFSNYILWLPRDVYSRRQLDLGFTRKNGNGVSGYGRLAKVTFKADFIIIIDIADRSATGAIPLTIPIRGLKGVDAQGNKKDLSLPVAQDTLWIKLIQTTGTEDAEALRQAIQLYPNPAMDAVTLFTGELVVEQIEIIGALGQTLRSISPFGASGKHRIAVSDLPEGVYTIRVRTEKGSVEKKLVIR